MKIFLYQPLKQTNLVLFSWNVVKRRLIVKRIIINFNQINRTPIIMSVRKIFNVDF